MERQRGTEARESGKRVKHGADRKISRKVNPDTTLPLMTGVKQCNGIGGFSSECTDISTMPTFTVTVPSSALPLLNPPTCCNGSCSGSLGPTHSSYMLT